MVSSLLSWCSEEKKLSCWSEEKKISTELELLTPAISLVIPTFNEAKNIDELLRQLISAIPAAVALEIIFVDDSTDDTPAIIERASARYEVPIMLVHRQNAERGLGGAVVAGLHVARAPWAVVMDVDLQHPPALLPSLLAEAAVGYVDLVVASRYTTGGSRAGLANSYRVIVSQCSNALARLILGGCIRRMTDPLSGFFALRRASLNLGELRPLGYKVLLEIIVTGELTRVREVPYCFGERHAGVSKSGLAEGFRYLRHLRQLRRSRRTARAPSQLLAASADGGAHHQRVP